MEKKKLSWYIIVLRALVTRRALTTRTNSTHRSRTEYIVNNWSAVVCINLIRGVFDTVYSIYQLNDVIQNRRLGPRVIRGAVTAQGRRWYY